VVLNFRAAASFCINLATTTSFDLSIYFKNPIIRNLYPLSAGLSIVGFNGEGFVTDTTGAYSSSQSILLGVLTMLAMLILSLIIISIPQKETLATPLSQKRRKTERKIAK
jgi:bacitracin transport system permease protein